MMQDYDVRFIAKQMFPMPMLHNNKPLIIGIGLGLRTTGWHRRNAVAL